MAETYKLKQQDRTLQKQIKQLNKKLDEKQRIQRMQDRYIDELRLKLKT
jgi:uncharacterized protein YlxW (UPF0749 family)